jgi:hypothetical protein
MKLVLYFGLEQQYLINKYQGNDIIKLDISKKIDIESVLEKAYCHVYTREYFSMMKENGLDELEFAINDIYYHNLKNIFALLNKISFFLKTKDIDELILVGGNKNFRYMPFYFAEAHEDGFQFLHKSSWYFNTLIYKTFNNKVKISFINEENIVKLNLIKRIRQMVLLFGISFLVLVKHIKKWKKFLGHDNNFTIEGKRTILFPARTIHQLRFILPTIRKLNDNNDCLPLVVFYEGLRAKDVDKFIYNEKIEQYLIPLYSGASIFLVLKSIASSIGSFFKNLFVAKKDLNLVLNDIEVFIPFEEIRIESTIGVYYKVYHDLLNSFLKKIHEQVSLIFSTEMTSKEAFLEKQVALKYNIKMYHFQTAMFEPKPMPILPIGDKFFTNSKVNQMLLSKIGEKSYGKVVYEGMFRYQIIKQNKKDLPFLKKILYATQPHDNQMTIEILKGLSKYLYEKKLSIEVFVKLHPRDNINNYKDIQNIYGLHFSDNQNINLDKLIEESDLVISRFSSMLQEALIIGTPYIACLFTKNDQSIKNDYLNHNLSVHSINDLIIKIENYKETAKLFNRFREKYFKENDIKLADIASICKEG